jgi:hypothetical protein
MAFCEELEVFWVLGFGEGCEGVRNDVWLFGFFEVKGEDEDVCL